MGRLSGISGQAAVKAFGRLGYSLDHQTGSHLILYKQGCHPLSVPNHRELAPGLVRGLIRRADIAVEDFLKALRA